MLKLTLGDYKENSQCSVISKLGSSALTAYLYYINACGIDQNKNEFLAH